MSAPTPPAAATDVEVLQLLADARREHLPQPAEVRILPGLGRVQLTVGAADHPQWRTWLTRRGAADWRLTTEEDVGATWHWSTGHWMRWIVEIRHAQLPALRRLLSDPVEVAGDEAAALTAGGFPASEDPTAVDTAAVTRTFGGA